jgi:predicted NAD-dependent protein-ADP-ribosyltransferase YbiA (DUF1768 family)
MGIRGSFGHAQSILFSRYCMIATAAGRSVPTKQESPWTTGNNLKTSVRARVAMDGFFFRFRQRFSLLGSVAL